MPTVHGRPACTCQAEWIPAFDTELARRGIVVRWVQLIGGGSKSGGTHSTGGAGDFYLASWPKKMTRTQAWNTVLMVARQMGSDAAWLRRFNWDGKGGEEHGHQVLRGCPHNGPARYQIDAVDKGYNGLGWMGRGGFDDGPRPLSKRTWQQGIAWAKKQQPRKATTVRVGTWNVDLKVPLPAKELDNRVRRIRRRVKQFRLDVLAVQECPASGQGKRLFGKLTGRDGKPMKRVGSHGRYIFHTARARDVAWTSFEIEGKRVTVAAMTISGIRRGFINAHPIGGSSESVQNRRTRYAEKVWQLAGAWLKRQRVDLEDAMYVGDHNGSEAGTVGRRHGFIRARGVATWKTALTRTYNAMGKRKPTHPGGQFDYMLIHQSKRKAVQRYRNVHTPNASDHNLVVAQVKE